MRISDWSSDVCSSDLVSPGRATEVRLIGFTARRSARIIAFLAAVCAAQAAAAAPRFLADSYVTRESDSLVDLAVRLDLRSEEHTSELQSLMRISYAVLCLNKKTNITHDDNIQAPHMEQ